MRKTLLIALMALTLAAGCSTPLTEGAARIRIIAHDAAAMSGCKTLGAVAGRSRPVFLESGGRSDAMVELLEAAARIDADTVAISSTTENNNVVTVQGVALKCR